MSSMPCSNPFRGYQIHYLETPWQGFFSKQLHTHTGIRVVSHACVSGAALFEAARRIDRQLENAPQLARNLSVLGVVMQVIGKDQQCSDLPEFADKRKNAEEMSEFNERGRGYGGFYASCGEENLLRLPCDRYKDHRDICTHEFAHTCLQYGLDENVRRLVQAQLQASMGSGRWHGAYASTNFEEFFAELSMWYFNSRGDYGTITPIPQEGSEWLKAYDPDAFSLLNSIYRGRLVPKDVKVLDLKPQPSCRRGLLRSSNGDSATLIIMNETAHELECKWVDYSGELVGYGSIFPGCNRSNNTYTNHVWWFMNDQAGLRFGPYVVSSSESICRIVLTSDVSASIR